MYLKKRPLRILAAILTLSISALLAGSIPAGAVNYSISRITNNTYPDYFNNYKNGTNLNAAGQLVWIAENTPGGRAILFRDSNGAIQQLATYNYSSNEIYIDVSNNDKGQVAWFVADGPANPYNLTNIRLFFKDVNNSPQLIAQYDSDYPVYHITNLFKLNNLGQIVWIEGSLSGEANSLIKYYTLIAFAPTIMV